MNALDMPLLLALAIDDPDREARLLRMVHDPAFTVDGRPCEVARLCASVRDLEEVIAGGAIDAVVVASQLGAIPFAHLVALAHRPVRMVVSAPDAADERWDDFPGGLVVGPEPSAELLALALAGDRPAVTGWRDRQAVQNRSSPDGRHAVGTAGQQTPPGAHTGTRRRRGRVTTIAGAYEPSGRTTVAVGLARALAVRGRAVLVDGDLRLGTTPFVLGLSAGHSLCHLADKHLDSPQAWDTALRSELQSLDDSGQTLVLAGVPRASASSSMALASTGPSCTGPTSAAASRTDGSSPGRARSIRAGCWSCRSRHMGGSRRTRTASAGTPSASATASLPSAA